ncbi:PP2C family protein-serine/threonine phosphatase [Mycolicibacterium thermoresistibile]
MSAHTDVCHRRPEPLSDRLVDELTAGLGGSLNLRRTALRLVSLIQTGLADWAMVVLPDPRTGALVLVGDADPAGVTVGRTGLDNLPLGRVLRSGCTEQIQGADLAGLVPVEPFQRSAAALAPVEAVGLGLTARGSTFGALVLLRGADAGFSAEDVAVAQRVADRAALALDSARLYEEQARVASVLQQSLHPPTLPEIPGVQLAACYRPAVEHLDIGGDFYDVTGRDDDWLIAIGDVCGKGVEAAALTGQTRQSIKTAAHFDRRPDAVLRAVNSVLCDLRVEQFVTVLCARVRPEPGDGRATVDLATAGHPAPLVLRADGRVEQAEVYGTAAGLVSGMHYGAMTLTLDRGDTMVLFTDGIDEAWGAGGQYGMARLHALLPAYAGAAPAVVCAAVEQDVMEYLDGRPHDDMAMLAVTCVG